MPGKLTWEKRTVGSGSVIIEFIDIESFGATLTRRDIICLPLKLSTCNFSDAKLYF